MGDSWENLTEIGINMGDEWKTITEAYVNVGDAWEQWWTSTTSWLGTWAKRRKIAISSTNIDNDITHYPIPVLLGTSVGTGNDDVSDIFGEIGDNSLKIAFTKDDGTTQLYAEISHWNDTTESGVVWVSKSDWTIASGTDTEIYIYFDNTKADNTTYVGEPGDTVSQNVWNSDYLGVWHLGEQGDETPGEIKDSTLNNNDGEVYGQNSVPTRVDAKIGKGQDFDPADHQLIQKMSTPADTSSISISAWVKHDTLPDSIQRYINVFAEAAVIRHNKNAILQFYIKTDDTIRSVAVPAALTVGDWYHVVGTWDGTTQKLYKNGVQIASAVPGGTLDSPTGETRISAWGEPMDGLIDEMRISNVARSAAWVKADFHSQNDNVVSFSSTETL